jgi:hypothetical protein
MQAYLGRPVDLLDPDQVETGLRELSAWLAGPALVVHTKYWAAAVGPTAGTWGLALQGGITMATTRYLCGDHFTATDYQAAARLPKHPAGVEMAAALTARLGDRVTCEPAFQVAVPHPTTIGLGDTFVGGFIAALSSDPASVPSARSVR